MSGDLSPRVAGLFPSPVELLPLLDELPLPLAVLSPDRRVVALNRAAELLTGYTREEARGISCRFILRAGWCASDCPLARLGAGDAAAVVEGDIVNRDRQKVPVRVTFAPVRDASGRLAGYLESIEDLRLLRELDGKKGHAYSFGQLLGTSPQMERVFEILPGIAQTDSSVLITGETGTGKDLMAEAIHQASPRAKGPFVKVNCGALPESLLESELFGYRKGAFTGAVETKPGRFRLAQNGTLFLTEIGDLPLTLQVKLLTFLDDKVIYPLGSTKGVHVDVRVIAATHRDLEQMVREGRFRQDLLFRLNVVRLHLPPLREREEDSRLMLDHFLHVYATQFAKPVQGFSDEALNILMAYPFPGNVRELRNIVEYAVNICTTEKVFPHHLPAYLTEVRPVRPPEGAGRAQPAPVMGVRGGGAPAEVPSETTSWPEAERRMILEALLEAKGRRGAAAERLGWGRSTLWRKMKQYGIDG